MPKTSRSDGRAPLARALAVAFEGRVVRRALVFAAVVGSVLVAINHGDALLAGAVTCEQLLKMGLTVLVPYVVSTWSSVLAIGDAE
jgi:hypothetical protein